MVNLKESTVIDWAGCPLVEVNPRKVSGVPILIGTRVQADSIVENYESGSPVEEIAENFAISEAKIREVLAFAGAQQAPNSSVRVLFDHNIPHKLRRSLTQHEVSTADEMGWAELEIGELLRAAENGGFAVMVTGDKNLSYQQNLEGRKLALVVLSTNDWRVIQHNAAIVVAALDGAASGTFQVVSSSNGCFWLW